MPKIYYVEDDAAIARFVKEYLEQKGCQVEIFSLLETVRGAAGGYAPGNARRHV